MSETRIEADVVYQHDKMGEVLVTGIAKMYDEWDVSGPSDDIESGEVFVYFHSRFDGYGGMVTPETELVADFAKSATRERAFEYENVSELQVDDAVDSISEQMEERDYDSIDPEDFTNE
jgi:hypothetical protein